MMYNGVRGARRRRRRGVERAVTAALAVGAITTAIAAGVVALLLTASLTTSPVLFVGVGVVVFLVVDLSAASVVARRAAIARPKSAWLWMFAATAVVVLMTFTLTALIPPAVTPAATPPLPGQQVIDLPTGSRLTLIRVAGQSASVRAPMLVLHGGPGIPELAANTAVFAPLVDIGADIYFYAQLGSGGSTRLSDPRGYGRDRDVADLEALRARLGLDRMVLIGHSYGATVAAAYLVAHPEHVESLVLLSPGALDPADDSGSRATADLGMSQRLRLYREVLAPRALLGYGLLQVNPAAAHAFLGDSEADARNDRVLTLARPALYCEDPAPTTPPVQGSGFYALQYPQSATAPTPADLRPRFTGLRTPALVIKGECDYLSWRSALDYRIALPRSELLYLPDTGHNLHHEQPVAVRAAIAAFVQGQPVPAASTSQHGAPPPDYRGPF